MDNSCLSALTDDGRIRLLASRKNWIEGEAVSQLRKTAALPGMRLAVGLPDLHPGRGHPVGAAFITTGVFYPQLVGNDMAEAGLIRVVATLKPRITYKVRRTNSRS